MCEGGDHVGIGFPFLFLFFYYLSRLEDLM